MKLSLSSLAIVGMAVSTLPNAAGHLRSIPPPSLVEDNAHSYDKGATSPLTKGTEEVNHNRVGRKLPRKKNKKRSKKKTSSPTGAPTIDPVKAALEKRATEAEDEVKKCLTETRKKSEELSKKADDLQNQLAKAVGEAKVANDKTEQALESQKAAKEAAEKSQEELEQSRDEAKKAAGKLQAALTQSQDEVTRMKKALGDLKAKAEETRKNSEQQAAALQAQLKQSKAKAEESTKKLESMQSNVCKAVAQVQSDRTEAAAVEKKLAAAIQQASGAMKQKVTSCVPEASATLLYKPVQNVIDASAKIPAEYAAQDLLPWDYEPQDQSPLQILPAEKEAQQYVTKEQLAQKAYASNISNALGNISNAQGPPLPKAQTETYSEAKQVDARQKQEAFDVTKLDQRQDSKQSELEEELKRASEKVEVVYNTDPAAYVEGKIRDNVKLVTTNGIGTKECAAATDAVMKVQEEVIRMQARYVAVVPDLSKLAATVECSGDVKRQQSDVKAVEGASFLTSGISTAGAYPFESDFKNLARAVGTDNDGK